MVLRKIIKIDEELCTGCGKCVLACAEGAIEIVNGKAKVISDKFCDGLGACIGECPEGALTIEERDVEEFDEKAVEEHLKHKGVSCPSAQPQVLNVNVKTGTESGTESESMPGESMLGHWPIKLMLVPEIAPFLQGRDLVVIADCAGIALPGINRKFLNGNAVVIGCPKFDDINYYQEKLKRMFKNSGITGVSVVHMEVPCCFGLMKIVSDALKESGKNLPLREYIVGIKGTLTQG